LSPRPLRLDSTLLLGAVLIVYVLNLGATGFISADEPRYASIGREMARSGDWITPRLDGEPWFEKPPLLYWLIALGHKLHFSDEWAARLPIALISVIFLGFFCGRVTQEFSERIAVASTAILATSAGWVAYSYGALTDLPMSAALGAAMLIMAFDTRPRQGYLAGALLGIAILAKAFVPVVLFFPAWLIARRKRLRSIAAAVVVAAPWHLWCLARNGHAFWNEYFWKHQVGRFFEASLQHVQPFWFFIPVILAGLFPWTPLVALLARGRLYQDERARFLAAWLIYGFLFFSIARNKLPGYVLPLLPALAILLAMTLDKAPGKQWWVAACGVLLIATPAIARTLPDALLFGLRHVRPSLAPGLPFLIAAALAAWLAWRDRPSLAVLCVAAAAMIGIVYIKARALPALDQRVSVRAFWREHPDTNACLDWVRRDWVYGLNYYAGRVLPSCEGSPPGTPVITGRDDRLTYLPTGTVH
jgi:4-amino-4-deoxy-L-arabinose transferase-like glycosyltransferase